MANYYQRVQYLYPNIQNVVYWFSQHDGSPFTDPYDGLIWENAEIEKPTKEQLDLLSDAVVEAELLARDETIRKTTRDNEAKKDLSILAGFDSYRANHNDATLSDYLDYLESIVI